MERQAYLLSHHLLRHEGTRGLQYPKSRHERLVRRPERDDPAAADIRRMVAGLEFGRRRADPGNRVGAADPADGNGLQQASSARGTCVADKQTRTAVPKLPAGCTGQPAASALTQACVSAAPAKQPGDVCTDTSECISSAYCPVGGGACTPKVSAGDNCTTVDACPAGLICEALLPTSQKICRCSLTSGAGACIAGQYCDILISKACKDKWAAGHDCDPTTQSALCLSGSCVKKPDQADEKVGACTAPAPAAPAPAPVADICLRADNAAGTAGAESVDCAAACVAPKIKTTCTCGSKTYSDEPCKTLCPAAGAAGAAGSGAAAAPAPSTYDLPNFLGVDDPNEVIGRIVKYIMGFVGTIALVTFMYGGVLWLISSGREAYVDKGRDTMVWSAVGMVVVFASYLLVDLVFKLFGK